MWFLYAVNNDPTYFPEPDIFKPERFLDKQGAYCKNERHIPFGIGKRGCPGEVLSRAELFLFVTRLIQQFRISAVSQDAPSLKGLPGFVFYPMPFDLLAEEREGKANKDH